MDLMELREQIDGIDAQIVALFEQRMDISRHGCLRRFGSPGSRRTL